MKDLFTYISLLFIGFLPVLSLAQGMGENRSATLNVRATATVMDNLQMVTIRNLDLVNPLVVENQILVSPITSSFAGMFRIVGNSGARVRITYLQNEVLREYNEQLGEVVAQYRISGFPEDNQLQSVLLDVGEGNIRLSEKGQYYVWLVAVLDLSKATPGLYLSEFIIELEYI